MESNSTAFLIKIKLRHSLGRPSRSDFVQTGFLSYTNKVIDTKQAFICNSRPRRFGKSTTADMLAAYYSKGCDSENLFADLAVSDTVTEGLTI